jgi:hypothetical protein
VAIFLTEQLKEEHAGIKLMLDILAKVFNRLESGEALSERAAKPIPPGWKGGLRIFSERTVCAVTPSGGASTALRLLLAGPSPCLPWRHPWFLEALTISEIRYRQLFETATARG